MEISKELRLKVAMAIYGAAFQPQNPDEARRKVPSPGWAWEKASEPQRQFCFRQADAAIKAMTEERTTLGKV